jgi:hypothetical protein
LSGYTVEFMKIPGISFSLKRALGISAVKQKVAKSIGIPTTRQGVERKIGGAILKAVTGKSRKRR